MAEFLARGDAYLADYPNFRLVGRKNELKRLAAILMRSRANSVLLVGPGGVGCTALCLGLQAMKKDPEAPFDIVSKRFFWLDTDGLFSSGNVASINAAFQKILNELYRTPDSVLIIEDTKDFIEAARNNGSMHFINALTLAVDQGKTQIILEARDDDLDVVLKCHSDMRECFTMLDLEEPLPDALREIVRDSAAALSRDHGGIRISTDAIEASIELTSKYRTRDMGLSRAQPERSVTLLDRAMATYRLSAHETPIELLHLEERLAQPISPSERIELEAKRERMDGEWRKTQDDIRKFYRTMREGEIAIIQLEEELATQAKAEAANKGNADALATPRKLASFARQ